VPQVQKDTRSLRELDENELKALEKRMASDYARMRMAEARLKHGFYSTPELPPGPPPAMLAAGDRLVPAQDEERNRVRDELCSMLREEIESRSAAYRERQARRAQKLSPSLRDACLAPNHPRADFMLRTENSAVRPVARLTRLLIQVQQARKQQEAS